MFELQTCARRHCAVLSDVQAGLNYRLVTVDIVQFCQMSRQGWRFVLCVQMFGLQTRARRRRQVWSDVQAGQQTDAATHTHANGRKNVYRFHLFLKTHAYELRFVGRQVRIVVVRVQMFEFQSCASRRHPVLSDVQADSQTCGLRSDV